MTYRDDQHGEDDESEADDREDPDESDTDDDDEAEPIPCPYCGKEVYERRKGDKYIPGDAPSAFSARRVLCRAMPFPHGLVLPRPASVAERVQQAKPGGGGDPPKDCEK